MKKTILTILVSVFLSIGTVTIFYVDGEQKLGVNPFEFERQLRSGLDRVLPEKIIDIVWGGFFYYQTFFESIDAFGKTGTVTSTATGLSLETGASIGNSASISLTPTSQSNISFTESSRFRTYINFENATSQLIYVMVGDNSNSNLAYGFRIASSSVASSSIMGFAYNGTSETTTTVFQYVTAGQIYYLEASYNPGRNIIFSIDNPLRSGDSLTSTSSFALSSPRVVGSLTSGLPNTTSTNSNLFKISVETEAGSKIINLNFFEYIQRRNVLR